MTQYVSAAALQSWVADHEELALFDVREAGQFGEGHLFFAVPLPYGTLEVDVLRLAPRKAVRLVVTDDGDGLAELAARRLEGLGYTRVFTLEGGIPSWQEAGFPLFKGVNVPSKTFGELVEHAYHTPHVTAEELHAMQRSGAKLALLDGRTVEEHHKMTIPGAISCPNGELAYRLRAIVPDSDTTVVVNCAGRTRSIIGAETLRSLGIANPVFALENGTQGWYLHGLDLEHGSERRFPSQAPAKLEQERQAAKELLARHAIPVLSADQAQQWVDDGSRTTYVFDVRTAEESADASLAGARHAPGGQLIQATDQYVGTRRSRLILVDDDGVRAPAVAGWMHQLGFDVAVLEHGIHAPLRLPAADTWRGADTLPVIDAVALRDLKDTRPSLLLIDIRPSMTYRKGHADGALWLTRQAAGKWARASNLSGMTIVLVADRREAAELIAIDLRESGLTRIHLAENGNDTLAAAGYAMVATPSSPPDGECIDYLFFVHDRHEGNKAAARQYLAWETGLIAQCTATELSGFRLPS